MFFKVLLITLLYIQLNKILLCSTRYESILLNFIRLIRKIKFHDNKDNSYYFLVLLLTSQFLEKSIFTTYIFYLSVKLKYYCFIKSNNYLYTIYILIHTYIKQIKNDTCKLAYNLWNKRITAGYFIF